MFPGDMASDDEDCPEEFVTLLISHQQSLRVFILSLMPGYAEAWDVLQQTNMVLWRKRSSFTVGTNFRAWAFKIARFEVLSFLQREQRRGWMLFDNDMMDLIEREIPADPLALERRLQALEACMDTLKAHDRELIRRRYLSAGNLEEYARQLGRTVGTLKTRLFRLRVALRQCITRRLGEEGLA